MAIKHKLRRDSAARHSHGFSDASTHAYGACIYPRTLDQNGVWSSNLLCSKSRVAPIKNKVTIPRLELCGALLLEKLTEMSETRN